MKQADSNTLDDLDRRIVQCTQAGLPLVPQPYRQIADQLGSTTEIVIARMQRMLDAGIIRRIGAVPNHYTLGFRSNGMSVWDVDDDLVVEYGRRIGELEFVSHSYRRPRYLPEWRYNLFAMVHGKDREEVMDKVNRIAAMLGQDNRAHEVLFSTRILKKTGLRIGQS